MHGLWIISRLMAIENRVLRKKYGLKMVELTESLEKTVY
jgi:hypothetical protein